MLKCDKNAGRSHDIASAATINFAIQFFIIERYRMKKLFKMVTATALVSACATTFAIGLSGCMGKTTASSAPSDTDITRLQPPADGSLPTAHTAQENLAYMAYVLDSQQQYHCYTYTVTQASIATQYTKSYKDYRDGVTISSDITYSDMVKSGSQACFVNGANGPEAYMRFSSAPDSSTTNLTADWSMGAPQYFDEQTYLTTYGLFQTEMTNYIINPVTITDSSVVVDNRDGTYTQSVTLDPVASTYYYQYGMKNRGGLTGFPNFQNVSLVFTFDSSWRVLSVDVNEVATVNKGVEVTSVSTSHAEYSYDPADFDEAHYAYYDSYFKQYIGSEELLPGGGAGAVLDATSVLANGFSGILGGGQQFEVEVTLGDNSYVGYIFIGLDLNDPLGTLELSLQLGKTLEEQGLFVEYAQGQGNAYIGEDFALSVNTAALGTVIDSFTAWADDINDRFAQSAQEGEESSSSGDVLGELFGLFDLTYDETAANITLATDNLLGLGVGVDARLNFALGEDESITFTDATVGGLTLGGDELAIGLAIKTTDAPKISRDPSSTPADLSTYAADIFNLLTSDCVGVNLSLDGTGNEVLIPALNGVKADVKAYVDADGIAAAVLADVSYSDSGRTFSAQIGAYYNYNEHDEGYGNLIVELTNINGMPAAIRVGCSPAELYSAVTALLNAAEIDIDGLFASQGNISVSLADILNNILSADFSSLLTRLSADANGIHLTVDIDEIIGLFAAADTKFGTLNLGYTLGGENGGKLSASLAALGLSVSVESADTVVPAPSGEYLDLAGLLNVVTRAYETIDNIVGSSSVNLVIPSGDNYLTYGNLKLAVTGTVSAKWGDGQRVAADLNVRFAGSEGDATTNIKLIYNAAGDEQSPLVRLSVNGAALDIYREDLSAVQGQISTLSSATAAGSVSSGDAQNVLALVLDLLSDGEWVNVLNNFTLATDGQSVALRYLSEQGDVSLSLDAQDGLSVGISATYERFSYSGRFDVVGADIYSYVNRQIELSSPASTREGATFTKVIYGYIFDAFNAVDLTDVLGGAYSVGLELSGDNSGLPQLEGVNVSAQLSFARYNAASNVADLAASVVIDGVRVDFNITLIGEQFYVSVTNVCGNDIPALKLTTTADSLYGLLSQLVGYAVNAGVLGGQTAPAAAGRSVNAAIADILYSLANINFSDYVTASSTVERKVLEVDLGGLLAALGVSAEVPVGSLTAILNEDLTFGVSAANGGNTWLSVNAFKAEKDYSSFDKSGYIDFGKVTSLPVADILALVDSDVLDVAVTFSHGFDGGHNADIAAHLYLGVSGLTAAAEADLTYTYKDKTLSAHFTARYTGDKVYVGINSINGAPASLGVYCNVDELGEAVQTLLAAASINMEGADGSASDILGKVLALDFSKVLSNVYADEQSIKADVDLDAVASGLGLDISGLGGLSLGFRGGVLTGCAEKIGLSLALSGADSMPAFDQSSAESYVDLVQLTDIVTKAYTQISGIIKSQSLAFAIDAQSPAYITVDGITAAVWGEGEISWANGGFVALDLSIALSEGINADTLSFQLIYDGSAQGDKPFVTLAINKTGVQMTRADVEGVQASIQALVNSIAELTGNSAEGRVSLSAAAPATYSVNDGDDLVYAVLAALSGTDWVEALGDLTLTANGGSVVLAWAQNNLVTVGAGEQGLIFGYSGGASGDGASFETGAHISLSASSGKLGSRLAAAFTGSDYSIASSADGSFIKVVYDNLLEAVRSISLDNILGSNIYNVSFDIIGSNTGIAELQDVFVSAEMFVKNKPAGGTTVQLDLNFNISGAAVIGSVVIDNDRTGKNTDFYIDLTQVLNITLNGLRVKASQETLYQTVSSLISIISDTDILSNILPAFSTQPAQEAAALSLTEDEKVSLSQLLSGILSADFSKYIYGATSDGVTTAVVDLDGIMGALGLDVGSLGAIGCTINHASHSITSSAAEEGKEAWLSLSSTRLSDAEADKLGLAIKNFDASKYIDIAFLPTLVNDLKATVTDGDGNMYDNITFTGGTISANIVGLLTVNISDLAVTINLDPENFYFSLEGNLSGSLVTNRTIGLTYHNGYFTLYRGDNGGEYRVMTLEYFVDNMFGDGDTLNWLLGVNSFLWSTVKTFVPEVSSGLTIPGDYYLYSREENVAGEEISVTDYINAINVILGGNEVLNFTSGSGDVAAMLDNLGISSGDNFYAFDLNARLLTGDVLTALSAAIFRDANGGGITGVKAYGAIQSYVTFTVSLGYSEESNSNPVGSHYSEIEQTFLSDPANYSDKSAMEIFGCYNSADGSVGYSELLQPYTLTIENEQGEVIDTRIVREGFTVYTYSNYYPEYNQNGQRVVYYNKDGALCSSFVMTGDTTITAVYSDEVKFTVHNSAPYAPDFEYSSFVGDVLPAGFEGYATIDAFTINGTPISGLTVSAGIGTDIYGSYAPASQTVNYVTYTYDAARGGYVVTGTVAGFLQYYVEGNRTLVLENEICGRPVVAIGSGAFQNANYDANGNIDSSKSVKNVVVSANITYVGESAFKDNVGMQSIVFLADSVTFGGTDDDKTLPFYGCSRVGEEEYTDLAVYYTDITASSGDKWNHFRTSTAFLTFHFYVGENGDLTNSGRHCGGELHSSGWNYVSGATVVDSEGLFTDVTFGGSDLSTAVGGLVSTGITSSLSGDAVALQTAVQALLDGYASNMYTVSVSVEKDGIGANRYVVNVFKVQYAAVTVKSSRPFTYNGVYYGAGSHEISVLISADGSLPLSAPASDGATFYGWYADEAFTTQVSSASADTTLLVARWQYTLTLNFTNGESSSSWGTTYKTYFYVNGSEVGNGTACSFTTAVLEGEALTVTASSSVEGGAGIVITGGQQTLSIYANRIKKPLIVSSSVDRRETLSADTQFVTVSGDISVGIQRV